MFPHPEWYLCICVSVYLCICVSVYLCICVSVLFWQYLRGIYDTTVLCKWELRIIFYVVAVSIHTRYIMYVLHDLHVLLTDRI